jgi:hypothetical protein
MRVPVLVKLKGRPNVFVVKGKIMVSEDKLERKYPSPSKTVCLDTWVAKGAKGFLNSAAHW